MARHAATSAENPRVTSPLSENHDHNGFITRNPGYSKNMTALRNRPARIAGMEWGTALLALATCLTFTVGIAAITQSVADALIATASIAVGLAVTLRTLRSAR